jgi:hypothetical protein
MGIWETVTGRRRTAPANLDALFEVPSAAITLQTALGLTPTGEASVCFRAATGAAFDDTQREAIALLEADPVAPAVRTTTDSFGFTWLSVTGDPADTPALCTDLHAVNTSLEANGFGPGLLCTLVPFADGAGRRLGLVYLYKQGTFYPFAPTGPQQRDNLLEISVRDTLAEELPMEQELSRWLAVWEAPGL